VISGWNSTITDCVVYQALAKADLSSNPPLRTKSLNRVTALAPRYLDIEATGLRIDAILECS